MLGLPLGTVPVPSSFPSFTQVTVEPDLPAGLVILAILEAYGIATDAALARIVLALDHAIGAVEFRVGP